MIAIEPGKNGEFPYRTHAILYGGTVYIKVPPEITDHGNLSKLKEEDGPQRVPMMMLPEEGPHGEYYSAWNQRQQGSEEGEN